MTRIAHALTAFVAAATVPAAGQSGYAQFAPPPAAPSGGGSSWVTPSWQAPAAPASSGYQALQPYAAPMAPTYGASPYGDPVYGAPAYAAPAYGGSAYGAPAYPAPPEFSCQAPTFDPYCVPATPAPPPAPAPPTNG